MDVNEFCDFVRKIYGDDFIALHRPVFTEIEKRNLTECIDSNFVSSVGKFVDDFEDEFVKRLKVRKAVATVNGTSALHAALFAIGVCHNTEVITQALTFVATGNAIKYCGADPVFVDVDLDTLGMSPVSLKKWLESHTRIENGVPINKKTGKIVKACLPMHTFGLPCRISEISAICDEYRISLIEDAAESLGSYVGKQHTGTFGLAGTFSFNGNKLITTGGGGMIVTNDENLGFRLKHLTTTAKQSHPYEYFHTELGFNYRMPNVNAALGVAQITHFDEIISKKKQVALKYREFFKHTGIKFIEPIAGATSNHWLNAIVLNDNRERDNFLRITNERGIMTRPIWKLLNELPIYVSCEHDGLQNSKWLAERVVNIPSSVQRLD